jgi:DNA-binding transcriptional LysR family regulator
MQEVVQEMITFAVVNREGSLTAAAQALGKSKGYVSTHIARLESFMETKLLFRSTRKIALTKAGALLLPHCEALVERLDLAKHTMSESHEQMSGEIRLTIPMSFGHFAIQTWISEFKQLYPNVMLSVSLSNTPFDLENSDFDLAIRAANDVSNLDYVAVHLASFHYALYASKQFLMEKGEPKSIGELAHYDAVLHSEVDATKTWQLTSSEQTIVIEPKVSCSFNSAEACMQAAQMGLGVARLPEYLAAETDLIKVLSHYQSSPIAVQLIYPYQGQQPRRVRALIDFLKAKRELGELLAHC